MSGRNMDIKSNSDEGSDRCDEHNKASADLENTHTIMNNAGRNMNAKDAPSEVSRVNKKHVIGNWRKTTVLVIKWQKNWLKLVMLGGKQFGMEQTWIFS